MNETRDKILDSAQALVRGGGYGAFSFRDIATELGIKSASVHYHFPTKEELCAAVTERYRLNFLNGLGNPLDENAISQFISSFSTALKKDGKVCLCGILASEAAGLSQPILDEVDKFAKECRQWLTLAFEVQELPPGIPPNQLSHALFSALEGAMAFAQVSGQHCDVEKVATTLLQSWRLS